MFLKFVGVTLVSILFGGAIFAEGRKKTAETLMNLDAHLAPNWYFGGHIKSFVQIYSSVGGVVTATLLTYFLYEIWGLWSITAFFMLLYLKYLLSERMMLSSIPRRIPAGWKSPIADAEDDDLLTRLKAISERDANT